MNSVE